MTTNQGNTMNIDNLTYGELKQIATLFSAVQPAQRPDPMVGQYVICRCYSAGVHAGVLVSQVGDVAVLKDSRRLWSWAAKEGVALSGVAQHGIKKDKSKIDTLNPLIRLTGVIETIPASQTAQDSIND
jgi:hypothetical protein